MIENPHNHRTDIRRGVLGLDSRGPSSRLIVQTAEIQHAPRRLRQVPKLPFTVVSRCTHGNFL